jgi:hypothetical protein
MEIGYDIDKRLITLKVDLHKLLIFGREIIGILENRKDREAFSAAIGEIRKSFETVFDIMTPLFSINNEATFANKFDDLNNSFQISYLNNNDLIRTHCSIAKEHLDVILSSKEWKAGLLMRKQSYLNFKELCDRWALNDKTLADEMKSFLNSVDTFYKVVSGLARADKASAFTAFRSYLIQFQLDFQSLQEGLNDLDALCRETMRTGIH